MEQLLIVEDDIGLNQGLCKALKADDRQIISCQDLKTAKEQLLCGGVSLILLDINLPGDQIHHKTFGDGLVISVTPMGGDALLEVAFDTVGTKKLMLKTAGVHITKL